MRHNTDQASTTAQQLAVRDEQSKKTLSFIEYSLLGAKAYILTGDASLKNGALEDINAALEQLEIQDEAH